MDVENGSGKEQLITALRELAHQSEANAARSKRARLNDIFDEVEAVLSQGVKQKYVIAALEKNGLVFTLRSFETTYARIKGRKKQERKSGAPLPVNTAPDGPVTGCGKNKGGAAPPALESEANQTPAPHKVLTASEMKEGLRANSIDPSDFD